MNSWLAQVYGTGGAQEQDLEKVAAATMLQKLAEEEGLSLDGLSPEQIDALAAEVLPEQEDQAGGQQGMIAQAGEGASEEEVDEEPTEELAKEAQAKFDEADFLGRTMAHAYTQELNKIAAAGGVKIAGVPGPAGFGRKAGNFALKAKMKGRAAAEDAGKAIGKHVGEHKKKYIAGGAAAGGAAAFGAGRMSKEAGGPIFRKLAEMRAAEILTENGIDPATGEQFPAAQTNAAPAGQPQLQQAVNDQAVQILKEAGYRFE